MQQLQQQPHPEINDCIKIRGGIEVMLKNALTGEVLQHSKKKNTVLYIGRNMLMTRAFATATQPGILVPNVIIGSGTTAANATQTGLLAYFTFKTGTNAQTTGGDGSAQPIFNLAVSWESTQLTAAGYNSVREFAMAFQTASGAGSSGTYLCRYVSASNINATTSNQLLITYTVSF